MVSHNSEKYILQMSFMFRMNKRGPRIEPWGTPHWTMRTSRASAYG